MTTPRTPQGFSAPTRRPLTIGAGVLGYDDVDTEPAAAAPAPPAPTMPPVTETVAPATPPAPPTPEAPPAHGGWSTDAAVITHQPATEADPFFAEPDPADYWDTEEGDDEPADDGHFADPEPLASPRRSRRATRKPRVSRTAQASTDPSQGKVVSGLRLLVGLDRRPSTRGRKAKMVEGGEPSWLVDSEDPEAALDEAAAPGETAPDQAETVAAQPDGPPVAAGSTPVRAALLRRRLIAPDDDLEVVKAPREWSSTARRVAGGTVLALFLFAGVKQVLWNPIFGTKTATTTAAGLDQTAADAAATRYALDYFSYSPASAAAGQSALQTDVVGGADITAVRWTGTGYLHADSGLPGGMHLIDPTHAVIQVTVRITLGMPPAPKPGAAAAVATTTAAVPSAATADPGVLPAGWTNLGSRWLTVSVPIDASSGAPKVAASGPVLSGENPGQVTAVAGAVGDTTTSSATQGVASSFFTAYAKSDVAYLAAPGVSLLGLSGAVTLTSLTNWTVAVPAGTTSSTAPTTGVGTGTVTWQLAGTDLQIKQQYSMALSNSQSRWYAAALSPLSPIIPQ